jgi:glycosyltransferase involved in cell wall biosynthesis
MSRRILFIDEDQARNGSTVSMEYLVRGFAAAGFEVSVLTWKQEERAKGELRKSARLIDGRWGILTSPTMCVHFTYTASPLSWAGMRNIAKDVIKFVLGFLRVRTVIRRERPDIVYLNEYSVIQAAVAARMCGVPAVVHVRSRMLEGKWGIRRWILSRLVLRYADAIFAITAIEAEQWKARESEHRKIAVVGEFVPLDRPTTSDRTALLKDFGLPADRKLIVMVGGVMAIKGTRDFLEAGTGALARCPDAMLVLAGGTRMPADPDRRAYHELTMEFARKLEREDRLRLLGEIINPLDLMAVTDVLVVPTRVTHFSRPVVEAWGFAKPVIAYRVAHLENLMRNEVDGLLVEPGDVAGLTAAMVRLIENPLLCKQLGEAGRRKTAASFDAKENLSIIVARCSALCGAA